MAEAGPAGNVKDDQADHCARSMLGTSLNATAKNAMSEESASMTTAFENRRQVESAAPYSGRARKLAAWLADQWPKAAIGFALAVTIAWAGVLVWSLTYLLDLF